MIFFGFPVIIMCVKTTLLIFISERKYEKWEQNTQTSA